MRTQRRWHGPCHAHAEAPAHTGDELSFDFSLYVVTLPKPVGLQLGKGPRGEVMVARVDPDGHAAATGLISVGDELIKTSAVFGEEMWEAKDAKRSATTMRTRKGDVRLMLRRAPQGAPSRGPSALDLSAVRSGGNGNGNDNGNGNGDCVADASLSEHEHEAHCDASRRGGSGGGSPASTLPDGGVASGRDAAQHAPPHATVSRPRRSVARPRHSERGRVHASFDIADHPLAVAPSRGVASDFVITDLSVEGAEGLLIGSAPLRASDMRYVSEYLCCSVAMCLVPEDEVTGLSHAALREAAKDVGVTLLFHPIKDFDKSDLRRQLPGAVARLARAVRVASHDERPNVLAFCTHAVGRSPAVAVAYLSWFCGAPLLEAHGAVRSAHGRLSASTETVRLAAEDMREGRAELCGTRLCDVRLASHALGERNVSRVHLAGEFTSWRPAPMTRVPAASPDEPDEFRAAFRLPWGLFQYKFLVDHEWLCDLSGRGDPTVRDGDNLNHVIASVGPQNAGEARETIAARAMSKKTREKAGDQSGSRDGDGAEAGEGSEAVAFRTQLEAVRLAFAVDPRTLGVKTPPLLDHLF